MIERSAYRAKAAVGIFAKLIAPIGDILKWLATARYEIKSSKLFIDASVAVSISISGESNAMAYIKKTQAIDLFWLRGAIRELDITPQKMPSGRNIADLWTAAVTRAVLLALLDFIGRRAPAAA